MNYMKIEKCSLVNGTGVRVVLWVSGCLHKCKGCHNPETWSEAAGNLFDANAENELFDALENEWIEGITFSGGDPLHPSNRSTIGRLAKKVKKLYPNKNVWLYTGYTWKDVTQMGLDWLRYIDVCCEGNYVPEKRNIDKPWVGSDNQKVIMVNESLKKNREIERKEEMICYDKKDVTNLCPL